MAMLCGWRFLSKACVLTAAICKPGGWLCFATFHATTKAHSGHISHAGLKALPSNLQIWKGCKRFHRVAIFKLFLTDFLHVRDFLTLRFRKLKPITNFAAVWMQRLFCAIPLPWTLP